MDHETKDSYVVMVTATDPDGASASVTVTIKVDNVNEAPVVMRADSVTPNQAPEFADSEDGARSVAENTDGGRGHRSPCRGQRCG